MFHCPAIRELPQLIDESVRGAAAHIDSRDIAAATPPQQSELRLVRVRVKESGRNEPYDFTQALSVVADPVFKQRRKRKPAPARHRSAEVSKLIAAISEASVLLVGPSGCGKTTVAHQAATQMQLEARSQAKREGKTAPPPIVWASSAENLVAGMQFLGEWEQRLESVIAEMETIHGVLLMSSLIDLVRLGGSGPSDSLAAFLMPYVRRGEVRVIAETTADELNAARRLLPGWAECFQILNIDPLSHSQTRDIAETMLKDAARNHRLEVEETAAETATRLFAQFMPYQSPPRGVVQLVGDVIERIRRDAPGPPGRRAAVEDRPSALRAAQIRLSRVPAADPKSAGGPRAVAPPAITTADIVDQFTSLTGLPRAMLLDSQTLSADRLRDQFSREVIGQGAAVDAVTNVVLAIEGRSV